MDFDNPSYFSIPKEEENEEASEFLLERQFTPPKGKAWCKNKRTYLRSVSTNSADSNNSLLINGEPRLSDIAPGRSLKKDPPSRSSSLKGEKSEFISDLSYLPESFDSDNLSGDEVFIDKESVRYHNFPAFNQTNQRRHSIGTFIVRSRDRTNSGASTSKAVTENSVENMSSSTKSFKEDFPFRDGEMNAVIDDHSIRHASYPRKRCIKCTKGNIRNINMDDILIVSLKSSDAASLWVDYFSTYFQQISKHANRKPFKIQYTATEEIIFKSEEELKDLVTGASGVKLQLVVICPSFLDFITEHADACASLGKIFLADRTLALLLGVNDNDLTEVHKKVLPTYFHWQRQCVGQDQDENFTKEFLAQAMAILSKVWKQQISITAQEKSCFSVTPKKIRQGQNSVSVLLTYPLQKEDIVKISVEKNGELFEIKTVKRRNPYVMKFWMPEALTQVTIIVNVLVEKNGSIIGSRPIKCESKLRELDQILRSVNNPIDFMCQAVGFSPSDKDHLDNWLVHNFQKNLPPNFNLLTNCQSRFAAGIQGHKHSHEEFPTLLHFAAKFGLEKLAMQLLECPGAEVAYEYRNIYDMTPLELAEANGFSDLAIMFRGFMNINEFTNMYAKLMEISGNSKSSDTDDEGYMVPKTIQEFYKLCPAPKPVVGTPSTPTMTPSPTTKWPSNLYMTMHTPGSLTKEDSIQEENPFNFNPPAITKDPIDLVPKNNKHTKKSEELEDKVQKELAEIINDFKNNIHSITQAEKLVDEWKNRNDVQKSFQEKQEQLMEMRIKYEQIQNKMKSTMKKPTPFERMKKLFSKHKEDKECHHKKSALTATNDSSTQRPISSLSTSSSGSSGRMSTISGCSLGDSGTLSDNEDRTLMVNGGSEDEFRHKLNKAVLELNYNTLPAPKPVKVLPTKHTFETIEEKPVTRPDTLNIRNEFYIEFPPSGLPVSGLDEQKDQASASNEYMNIAVNSHESHEYMNFKVPAFSK
ncbi:unnamed protein product [Psylliodes chrysocephalus]|uniref:DBB domain-containing protein n=1 Tax=Psylliodes chrysocephalus TaxID=3402493 RepID=A0A9P0CI38_9CUCU|nr:unnamed protein product [Psylliodes chrysocephala]